MADGGGADCVAHNVAVSKSHVHFIKSRPLQKHEREIEATVGNEHMVRTLRDRGELFDLRGGRL